MHMLETSTLWMKAAADVTPNRRLARIDKRIDRTASAAEASHRRELHERRPERDHRLLLCHAFRRVVGQITAQPIDVRFVPEILQSIIEALCNLRVTTEPLLNAPGNLCPETAALPPQLSALV